MVETQQEFAVQGIQIEALFMHQMAENLHLGIVADDEYQEERIIFMVIKVENGMIRRDTPFDDFASAHCRFMKLYESSR